jgi:hypothetical protein
MVMGLVGKEFTSVEFHGDKFIVWDTIYKKTLGKTGIIEGAHDRHPEYICINFGNSITGHNLKLHWPLKVIEEQLKAKEEQLLNNPEYNNNLFKLIKKLCQQIK